MKPTKRQGLVSLNQGSICSPLAALLSTDRETQAVGSGDGHACGEPRRSSLQTLASIVPLAQEASATMGKLEEYEVMKVRQDACVHC